MITCSADFVIDIDRDLNDVQYRSKKKKIMDKLYKIENVNAIGAVTKTRYYRTKKGFINQKNKLLNLYNLKSYSGCTLKFSESNVKWKDNGSK
jgi:hypothetical protein